MKEKYKKEINKSNPNRFANTIDILFQVPTVRPKTL